MVKKVEDSDAVSFSARQAILREMPGMRHARRMERRQAADEPIAVRKARRIVASYERKRDAREAKIDAAHGKVYNNTRQTVLLSGSRKEIRTAMDALRRSYESLKV